MSLYEIDRNLRDIMEEIESFAAENEGEFPEELDKMLDDILGDKHTKIGNVCKLIKSLNAEQKAIKEEAKSLTARAKAAEKKADWFKNYIKDSLNGETFSDNNSKISYKNTPSVLVPETYEKMLDGEIPLETITLYSPWLKIKCSWDKTVLKAAIKVDGATVPGGIIMQTKKSMQIK